MSRYIHQGSFQEPVKRGPNADGRDRCDRELKKIFARGPQRPGSLAKRARDDADINAEAAMTLTKHERRLRSNQHEALEAIKKVHAAGVCRGLNAPEADGDPEFRSKSVSMVKAARAHALPITGNRLPNPRELNKLFAERVGKREVDLDEVEHYRGYASQFRPMTPAERREFRKGMGTARPSDMVRPVGALGPNSSNAQWDNARADDGAVVNWGGDPVPSQRPTIVGGQPIGTPSDSNRDAALEAVKRALRKPQHALTADMDDDEDEDGE